MANANDPQVPTTLNIPSIVAFAVISFFAIRYFFFSAPASSTAPGAAGNGARNGRRVDFARIDAVTQMFPQMSRRDVEWDLLRNGGSVQATTDKILRDGRLETVRTFRCVCHFHDRGDLLLYRVDMAIPHT